MRRIALTAALVALTLTLVPAGALAATSYVVSGAGFGHGVGMSQYGAYGYARHGYSYRAILAHYYRGTTLGHTSSRDIRVLLQSGRSSITALALVRDAKTHRARLMTYVATVRGSGFELRDGRGQLLGDYQGPVSISSLNGYVRLAGTALNGLSAGTYRGTLVVAPAGSGSLDAVNALPLEAYVAGVVPGEVEASWPRAALEAQAVAARSYALATDAGGALFDEYADTRSQMYKGMSGEQASTSAAVAATARQVVIYGSRIAVTNFFSTSGGHTEDVQNVFYGASPEPYLVGVRDPYDYYAPLHRWHFNFTPVQLRAKLGSLCRGDFRRLQVLRRGVSPRVISAGVVCAHGSVRASGVALRQALGLYDTWFSLTRVTSRAAHRVSAATLLARLVAPRRALVGSVQPAPPGRTLVVEREVGGRFRRVGSATTSAAGDYSYALSSAGVYRVRYGDSSGPAVRIT